MDLFLDNTPEFLKEAGYAARLSETHENWPQELTSELYKQLPFLSDYDLNVNLDRVDPQRGFAFGYADVSNKTERPEVEHGDAGLPHIRVPLIVLERAVKPFSTFLDGDKVLPLSEERVRETLFNPATFDISAQVPRDPSLVEPLTPPTRSGMGFGGEVKTASALHRVGAGVSQYLREPVLKGEALLAGGSVAAGAATHHMMTKGGKNKGKKNKEAGILDIHIHKNQHTTIAPVPVMEQPLSANGKPAQAVKAKKASVLAAIAPTIRERDAQAFVEKVASDPYLRSGFSRAGVAESLVEVFDKTKRASADERLALLTDSIQPSVVTLMKLPGGDFLVKSANVNALNPQDMQGQVVPGEEAGQAIGQENAQAMQPGQTATVVAEPIDLDQPYEEKAELISRFGQYNVMDTMGNKLTGWVFPETLAWDGNFTRSPLAIFSNGSAFAMQDSIAGELIGTSVAMPAEEQPVGEGVLFMTQGANAICTQPVTVKSAMAGPDGQPKLICNDVMGQQFVIGFVEGLSNPMRVMDNEYAFPKNWKFMRLNNQTQLQGGGQDMGMGGEEDMGADMGGASDKPKSPKSKGKSPDKKADKGADKKGDKKPEKKEPKSEGTKVEVNVGEKAKKEKTSATLWYNGGYNIDGGCGLQKLAADHRFDMSPVDAEFMLGLLGVDGITAKEKVAEARKRGSVKLAGLKTITTLSERYVEAEKTASALASKIPNLRRDLTKEAAALEDKGTVDNILALNFINPENLPTFVTYIPELEATSEKLAEMLLYNYLGMNELPEQAIERSMRNMEEVVQGLKAVAAVER